MLSSLAALHAPAAIVAMTAALACCLWWMNLLRHRRVPALAYYRAVTKGGSTTEAEQVRRNALLTERRCELAGRLTCALVLLGAVVEAAGQFVIRGAV